MLTSITVRTPPHTHSIEQYQEVFGVWSMRFGTDVGGAKSSSSSSTEPPLEAVGVADLYTRIDASNPAETMKAMEVGGWWLPAQLHTQCTMPASFLTHA